MHTSQPPLRVDLNLGCTFETPGEHSGAQVQPWPEEPWCQPSTPGTGISKKHPEA